MGMTLKQRLLSVPPLAWLLLLTLACLVPFAGKAFFIDDTLFLRAARQIQKHPLDFYGFNINWFGYTSPMTMAFDNPPLTSYYIALVTTITGWDEWGLHFAFLLPALAAVWGTYALAQNYCQRPLIASLVVLFTPVFLISATSLMCDVTVLAFWVWTMVFFERGLRHNRIAAFLICGCLGGLAVWTKYTALGLIPLLSVYGLLKIRRAGWWIIAPIITFLFAGAYGWITYRLYGHNLLLSAANFASDSRANSYNISWEKMILGMAFLGGCFLPALFFSPLLWSRKIILMMPCLLAACLLFIPRMGLLTWHIWKQNNGLNWIFFLQVAVLTIAGAYILLLTAADLWRRHDAVSLLLLLWISGILVFTIRLNWVINGRSLLPAVPAIGILVARRLELRNPGFALGQFGRLLWPLFPATVISLVLVKTDYDLAGVHREAAKTLAARYQGSGHTLWFLEHWGFQYYAEQLGARPLEIKSPHLKAGDIVIGSSHSLGDHENSPKNYLCLLSSDHVSLIGVNQYVVNAFCATMNPSAGAGFYAANTGPLPFLFGDIKPECFDVYQVPSQPTPDSSQKLVSLEH
jgi:4-amino-4-deoxy-L-arabinose transferase-like glycosyltransferase